MPILFLFANLVSYSAFACIYIGQEVHCSVLVFTVFTVLWSVLWKRYTVGRVLIAWFNDCVVGRSGQIANSIIAMVDPVRYYSIHTHVNVCESINLRMQEILAIRN